VLFERGVIKRHEGPFRRWKTPRGG
jgi:hypothetical protein